MCIGNTTIELKKTAELNMEMHEDRTIDPLGDLKKPVGWLPIEKASEQRHLGGAVMQPIGSKTVVVGSPE